MPYLVNIVIETDALVSEEQYSGIGVDVVSKLHAPHLGAIHVIDLCKYSNEAHRHQCSVAIAVAGGLVKYMSSELRKVEIVGDTNQPAQYPFAYPVYTSFDLALQRELPQMSVSSLVFSDIGLVPQATRLIIACRRRLVSLKFLCCGLRLFNELFRATDRTPLVYPHLEELHGALSNNDDNTDAPIFPEGVLPRLVYLHEIAKHVWQYNRGVISHLLVDTLLTIVLPRLQLIRTRTSQAMSFALENVPSLTYVSYYMTSEFPERLGSRVVVGQFRRLLMHRGLQYLRFYDQVPPVQLSSAHLQIECIALKYLDMGVIIVSFEAVVFLLRALKQVHTFFCAINDGQLISQTMVAELGDRPVSESLRLLGFYIIGGSVSSSQQYHVATRRPSEEIYCRMPNLHQLQLQGGSSRACEFLNKQKKEHRFEWSGSVAERVEVLDVDLFARTKQ
ncbi:hypothetical protein IW140_003168 [Coemansia sp. RSA 1813]|nr:hypothetical protein IW138_003522 [Coemansia sp. RSA 986]KAJ2214456.1 hypothetical protein EV179_002999 [Coemansia sp. RSA 487]KAJ2569323.1 hypothetical protein IW140_003168 [Coemansia sp. RSA 1813]